jgi:hypothetical protein
MEIAKRKDSVQWPRADESGPTMTINFVILRSPLLNFHDPETIVVSREYRFIWGLGSVFDNSLIRVSEELSASPSLPEILWNFSLYKDRARITLEQNPHFYLRCPADEGAYTPTFQRHPLRDPSGALEHNDTICVLFDRPGRVFLDTGPSLRIFGNVWSLNGLLIFRGLFSHPRIVAYSLTYSQTVLESLRENNWSDASDTICGTANNQ